MGLAVRDRQFPNKAKSKGKGGARCQGQHVKQADSIGEMESSIGEKGAYDDS